MKTFIVLYRDSSLHAEDPPFAFRAQADDYDHAEEQCLDAWGPVQVMYISETADIGRAYNAYWAVLAGY